MCFSGSTWPTLCKHDFEPWLKLFYEAKTRWPRVMDCEKDWMGNTRKQIKRQLTRLKEFQRKGKLKQNRIHMKTPPETKRKPRHRSATQKWLSSWETMWLLPKRLSFKQSLEAPHLFFPLDLFPKSFAVRFRCAGHARRTHITCSSPNFQPLKELVAA